MADSDGSWDLSNPARQAGGPPPEAARKPRSSPIGVGSRVDQYEVLSAIGAGGMGAVFRARDVQSGRDVALKVVLEKEGSTTTRFARFQREGEITASLNHPGIVRVHATGQVDGLPYLAYELVEGASTLDEVFAAEPDLHRRVGLLRDAAHALGYAHTRGVIHRDVKPENILVDGAGRVKVADFGLAAAQGVDRLTKTGLQLGTPYWMSPEQFQGQRELVGPRSDVWALGVVLYQALTGELPFDGETLVELLAQVVEGDPPLPSSLAEGISAELEQVCLRALSLEPEDRYPDGAALAEDLDNALQGRPVSAVRSGLRRRLSRALRGGKGLAALVGVAALLLLGLVALFAVPETAEPPPPPKLADVTAPVISLHAPTADLETEAPDFVFVGTVIDEAEWVDLRVAGQSERVAPGDRFEVRVRLAVGTNRVVVRSVDASGNEATPVARRLVRLEPNRPAWYTRLPGSEKPSLPLPDGIHIGDERGEYINGRDESVLVWVPAGTFRMKGGKTFVGTPAPEVRVTISKGYFIGKHEVTWAQYERFCEQTRRKPPISRYAVTPNDPVQRVTWQDAVAYCEWASGRLPTEAEWEYAARGVDARSYPWGNDPPTPESCNLQGDADGYPNSSPVGSYPRGASPFGCLDMAGNVWEWVYDWGGASDFPPDGAVDPVRREERGEVETPMGRLKKRIRRGGSWGCAVPAVNSSFRSGWDPDKPNSELGFRIVR